jgi:hypothetical protein
MGTVAPGARWAVDGWAWCAVDGGVQARTVDGLTVDGGRSDGRV